MHRLAYLATRNRTNTQIELDNQNIYMYTYVYECTSYSALYKPYFPEELYSKYNIENYVNYVLETMAKV